MKNSKFHLFIENFLIYGVGGVIGKIIPLIMVPVVTRLMPDSSYFGLSDLSGTLISIAQALAIMGMYDAMYRLFFEKDETEYKKEICSTTLFFTLGMSFLVSVILLIFKEAVALFVFGGTEYVNLVYISAVAAFAGATNGIISAPTRMENKRMVFVVMNTITPMLSYAVAIPLLLKGYYLLALPLSSLLTGISSELVFWILNRRWFSIRRFKPEYLKPLLKIAIPLVPNFLVYWIFNSSDRLMIANLLDVSATGIYSVGSKLGHASQLIYTAFAGGWQYFAFSTMHEKDQVKTNSLVFEYLGVISFACTAFIFALSEPIYKMLFESEYVQGYIIAPYLFLAPLLQMLFQVAANQFLVVKKTWPNVLILSIGAVVNIVLNLILIPIIGIEGAAVATLVGYAVSDVLCVVVLVKMNLHTVSKNFVLSTISMVAFIFIWRLISKDYVLFNILFAVMECMLLGFLYLDDLKKILKNIKRR